MSPTIQSVCLQTLYRKIYCIFPTFFSFSSSSSFCSPHKYILLIINIKIAVPKPADITFNKPHAFHPHHYMWEVKFYVPITSSTFWYWSFSRHISGVPRKMYLYWSYSQVLHICSLTLSSFYYITNNTSTLVYRHNTTTSNM